MSSLESWLFIYGIYYLIYYILAVFITYFRILTYITIYYQHILLIFFAEASLIFRQAGSYQLPYKLYFLWQHDLPGCMATTTYYSSSSKCKLEESVTKIIISGCTATTVKDFFHHKASSVLKQNTKCSMALVALRSFR